MDARGSGRTGSANEATREEALHTRPLFSASASGSVSTSGWAAEEDDFRCVAVDPAVPATDCGKPSNGLACNLRDGQWSPAGGVWPRLGEAPPGLVVEDRPHARPYDAFSNSSSVPRTARLPDSGCGPTEWDRACSMEKPLIIGGSFLEAYSFHTTSAGEISSMDNRQQEHRRRRLLESEKLDALINNTMPLSKGVLLIARRRTIPMFSRRSKAPQAAAAAGKAPRSAAAAAAAHGAQAPLIAGDQGPQMTIAAGDETPSAGMLAVREEMLERQMAPSAVVIEVARGAGGSYGVAFAVKDGVPVIEHLEEGGPAELASAGQLSVGDIFLKVMDLDCKPCAALEVTVETLDALKAMLSTTRRVKLGFKPRPQLKPPLSEAEERDLQRFLAALPAPRQSRLLKAIEDAEAPTKSAASAATSALEALRHQAATAAEDAQRRGAAVVEAQAGVEASAAWMEEVGWG